MKTYTRSRWLLTLLLVGGLTPQGAWAQADADASADADPTQAERFDRFEQLLHRTKLVGQFTIVGRENTRVEEYAIQSVKKTAQGDYWLFTARMKYGDKDVPLPPVPLEVKWAGDTPVITLTNLTIPLLGTFSARVIFYNNKYAGTWTHGEVGGHLFGVLEKLEEDAAPAP